MHKMIVLIITVYTLNDILESLNNQCEFQAN